MIVTIRSLLINFCYMKIICAKITACFLAVDHSGSFHYFSVICQKHGEQVRRLALHQKDMQGFNDNIQCLVVSLARLSQPSAFVFAKNQDIWLWQFLSACKKKSHSRFMIVIFINNFLRL